MRLRSLSFLPVLVLGSAAFGAACGASLPEPFALQWRGVDSSPSPSARVRTALAGKTFKIENTVDRRADPSKIGIDTDSHYEYRTTSNVAAFCNDRIKAMVQAAGFNLVQQGDYIIQSEIAELTVNEGGTFAGDARITFRVFSPGKPAFERLYEGSSRRWGRSHEPDNINEALSNSLASATQKLLEDEALADFLEGKAASPAATPQANSAAPAPAPAAAPKPASSGKGAYNL